ncbi:unnamed protein product [Ambrosiozyma monospora]|uniref:Unnamed protein product n=1 Tax=Ambrosiozyma monospora TaxID=43982 RepID=A0ACB5SSB2_AMBMO|nr:unnamed protein product [Ambrosiozyma monospora]
MDHENVNPISIMADERADPTTTTTSTEPTTTTETTTEPTAAGITTATETDPTTETTTPPQESILSKYKKMFIRRKKHIHPEFEIDYPTANRIFTPDYNRVLGTLHLTVTEPLDSIVSIEVGLRGVCIAKFTETKRVNDSTRKIYHTEVSKIFGKKKTAYESQTEVGTRQSMLLPGKKFDIPLDFNFPTRVVIPSSVEKFGDDADNRGYVTIAYEAYARVNYVSSFLKRDSFFEYIASLDFQGGSNAHFENAQNCNDLQSENIFRSKLKLLIPDESSGELVASHIREAHRHSRFIRQLFNDHYKKENIVKYTRDVQLRLSLTIPEYFNLTSSLSTFSVTIECPGLSQLEPDFNFKGVSTLLGLFEIESISLKVIQEMTMYCKGHKYQYSRKLPILTQSFTTDKPKFDIVDFTYDKERQCHYFTTSLGALIGDDTSIIDKLKKPVVGDTDLPGHFRNKNTLAVNIIVCDAQVTDHHTKKFKFHAQTTIDCTLPTPPPDIPPSYPGVADFISNEEVEQDAPPAYHR